MLTGILGDLHLQKLGYSEYIKDKRISEKEEILNFIVDSFKNCEKIIFLGDIFNVKNPLSETIKEFTSFLEKFKDKEIFIISGNHCLKDNGETALDYINEILDKKWNVITKEPKKIKNFVFAPYITKNFLNCKDNVSATKKLIKMLPEGDFLFHHFSMSDSKTTSGCNTNFFDEIVLPWKELSKKYKFVFGGHIHKNSILSNNVIVNGSIINNEVGEIQKYIHILDENTLEIKQIALPGRGIYGLENPTVADLEELPANSIVKVTITTAEAKKDIDKIKTTLERFDANMILENITTERKKIHNIKQGEMMDFGINNLLELYSREKNVPLDKLNFAFNLIK
jgi:DNA repair exonuclease SbcCD nuclease subunit